MKQPSRTRMTAKEFETIAQIDYLYFCLRKLQKQISKPKSPITKMVYEATGFDKEETKRNTKSAIEIITQIIELKNKIDADIEGETKLLEELKLL